MSLYGGVAVGPEVPFPGLAGWRRRGQGVEGVPAGCVLGDQAVAGQLRAAGGGPGRRDRQAVLVVTRQLFELGLGRALGAVTAGLDNPLAVRANLAAHGVRPPIAVARRVAGCACCVSRHSDPRACWVPRGCAARPAWSTVPDPAGPPPLDRWGQVARVDVVGCWFGGCGGAAVCRARCWQLARW
jgi:hypothetical protein